MRRIVYVAGFDGSEYSLDGPDGFIGWGDDILSRNWSRTLSARSVSGIALEVREVKAVCKSTDEYANELRRVFDRDLSLELPGELVVDDEWHMACFVPESSVSNIFAGGWIMTDHTVTMISRYWWRERSRYFNAGLSAGGLDYSHDHEHDLGFSAARGYVDPVSAIDSPVRITFYGPCASPYVTIGGNRYQVKTSVPSGSRLVIDATGSSPTVIEYDAYGNGASKFSKAVRDGGQGGGSYAFEKLPSGQLEVTWSGEFAFDIAWREQETEPPWNR